jgi:hypothetical protein
VMVIMAVAAVVAAVVVMLEMPPVAPVASVATAARKNASGGGKQHDSTNQQKNGSHDLDTPAS